jgi:hypothetical protein
MIMPPGRASNVPEQRGRTTMKPYCHERQGDKERRGQRGPCTTLGSDRHRPSRACLSRERSAQPLVLNFPKE